MISVIASYTKTIGVPATGLTLAEIDLYLTAIAKATGVQTVLWDGTQHPTAEIASLGMYLRQYAGEDLDANEYVAGAHYTGVTVLDSAWVTAGVGENTQAIRDALKLAPSAGAAAVGSVDAHLDDILADIGALPSAADIDTQLSGTHGAGAWGAGTGAFSVVYTAQVDGAPAAGVYCRMTTDIAGLLNIDAGLTNSLGQVTFRHNLPSGTTVYIWPSKDGVDFSFGGLDYDTEVIP